MYPICDLIYKPLKNLQVEGGAPETSLGQKYLTTAADPFDPSYNNIPDHHFYLEKLTSLIVKTSI